MGRIESSADMVVEPARQAQINALVDIGFHASVIAAAFPYARYGPPEFDGDGRIVGVEIFFSVTVHPVVLSGSVRKTDCRDKIVIVFVDDLRNAVS